MKISSIVFVYNADSGLLNEMKDYVHKIVSPASYGCKLCAITYGSTGMKDEWKVFIEQLGIPVRFLHRDEFVENYGNIEASFPCGYIETENDLELFISTEEMNKLNNLKELKILVRTKINSILD
ncbi:hypothetical protein [Methanohalophilus mahii]|uniref:hypothetical protein n=1 Tax=Methanohalophilus mahii TaxID=2176 RepID=UPI000A819D25|nr:hypothetical protein [Methanohalophilus mahii]